MTLLAGIFSGTLCADVSYQSTTRITAGVLLRAALEKEPSMGAKNPLVATYLIKGNRMATLTKGHTTILNLDNDTIYEINLGTKTYSSITFAQMKQILDKAMKDAVAPAFQVSSKSGRTKAIGVLTAREQIFTMTTGTMTPGGASVQPVANIAIDSWILTVRGFDEVADFRRRLAAKLGYTYALGMSGIGMVKPELLPGFEEAAKVIIQADEMPVETTIRMGGPGSGDLAPNGDVAPPQKGVVSGTLSRIGSLAHKKNGQQSGDEQDPDAPAILAELTTELSNFGGAVDESKFNVPAGFKESKPPAPKTGP
jgi:hypothetical protein